MSEQNTSIEGHKKSSRSKQFLAVGIFFVVLIYLVNRESHEAKSSNQIQYESWLKDTQDKTKTSLNNETLPNISLIIIPEKDGVPIEKAITANNIANSRDKIIRLLQLINEAGLHDYQTDKPTPHPGDIILKIQGGEKNFTLQFQPSDIENNVRATLLIKLFDEYLKDAIPENLAKAKNLDPKNIDPWGL